MRQTVARLISREIPGLSSQTDSVIATCEEAYVALSRWVGADGCHALFSRALSEARSEFPALSNIKLNPHKQPYMIGAAESRNKHGDASLAEGLESVLVRVFALLSRLIGKDIADKLIQHSFPEKRPESSKTSRPEKG